MRRFLAGLFPQARSGPMNVRVDRRPPPSTIETANEMVRIARRASGDWSVRQLATRIVGGIAPKDYRSEALAVYNFCRQFMRYTRDPHKHELVRDPEAMVREINAYGKAAIDCFPEGTLLLRDDHQLVPVEALREGDRIWGLDRWSEVRAVVPRGVRPIWYMETNNGSTIPLTANHKVFAGRCRHPNRRYKAGHRCNCSLAKGVDIEVQRIPLQDLQEGDLLFQPGSIPFGEEELDPDLAWLQGVYAADGWAQGTGGFSISGQDGQPKEAQKARVEEIAKRNGWSTRWDRKCIYVGADARHLIDGMGSGALEKRLPSLAYTNPAATSLLDGVMADSGANTNGPSRTFTTTSRMLAIQTRVLLKMAGITAGETFIQDHGGLGRNPIWRLFTRESVRGRNRRLMVKDVFDGLHERPVWDIETDDHYVWLPEYDVTVSNCDDCSVLIGSLCASVGVPIRFTTIGFDPRRSHFHVFPIADVPGGRLMLDPVAGPKMRAMARKVRTAHSFPI